jgi:hypothetical protein
MIAEGYAELAQAVRGSEKQEAAERLYALNPGGLRQNGIRLPAELRLETGGAPRNALRRALGKAGIEIVREGRFRLSITLGPDDAGTYAGTYVLCELYDAGRGRSLFSRRFPLNSFAPEDISAFIRALGDEIFIAP